MYTSRGLGDDSGLRLLSSFWDLLLGSILQQCGHKITTEESKLKLSTQFMEEKRSQLPWCLNIQFSRLGPHSIRITPSSKKVEESAVIRGDKVPQNGCVSRRWKDAG